MIILVFNVLFFNQELDKPLLLFSVVQIKSYFLYIRSVKL